MCCWCCSYVISLVVVLWGLIMVCIVVVFRGLCVVVVFVFALGGLFVFVCSCC